MIKTLGYAATAADTPLAPFRFERRQPGPTDVQIEILYCGVCHSDVHLARNEWRDAVYPVVPGHEIVGRVTRVGGEVQKFKEGDLAGVGCLVDSCRNCINCDEGFEQYCDHGFTLTYNSPDKHSGGMTYGGYSTAIVVDEDFVLRIPEGLDPAAAAPLLCAGITTYSPLRQWKVGKGQKVGVVGLGGLGHMAVKIAHALGAEVTVLSQSLKKQEDGLRLGADHYYATSDPGTFDELAGQFDLIVNTVSANLDVNAYLGLLAVDGTLVNVGAPPKPFAVNGMSLIGGRRSFAGSMIGGIRQTQEMLDFCAEHGIGSEVEVISADQVNEAYERVLGSDVRYRFVIDASTIG
jgi:uncharacterized zinc-type alcohol dehydrogenase-like protein